jgi:hypothetical protein
MSEEKTIRRRVNVTISTKGVITWDCTIEGTGCTQEEVLTESDALVAELKNRYPVTSEDK